MPATVRILIRLVAPPVVKVVQKILVVAGFTATVRPELVTETLEMPAGEVLPIRVPPFMPREAVLAKGLRVAAEMSKVAPLFTWIGLFEMEPEPLRARVPPFTVVLPL